MGKTIDMSVLNGLLDEFVQAGALEDLKDYLKQNSALPGPRGNLELTAAFAAAIGARAQRETGALWDLCTRLADVSPAAAPVNDPGEFLTFCGARGIGALGARKPELQGRAFVRLRTLASDPRWRVREGVAMALQEMLASCPQETLRTLDAWVQAGDWLLLRAVAAAVAEPSVLREPAVAAEALRLHRLILARVAASVDCRSPEFRVLRQGLGYSLSVVACAVPEAGFAYLLELAGSSHPDVRWIVKENLGKSRLTKGFGDALEMVREALREKEGS